MVYCTQYIGGMALPLDRKKQSRKRARATRRLRGGSRLFMMPFVRKRKSHVATHIAGVPLVIYQSWTTNMIPPMMKQNMMKVVANNPQFNHFLYSHEKCRQFIHDNYSKDVVDAFDGFKPGAFKSDLWRYCIMYKLGGVYMDVKFYPSVPLVDIINETPEVFIRDVVATNTDNSDMRCKTTTGLYNGFLVSPPNNPIFKDMIERVVENWKAKAYKDSMLNVTGPCLLGEIVRNHKGQEYIDELPFEFIGVEEDGVAMGNILYNDETIVKQYPEYRLEQANTKAKHYSDSWKDKDIYM